MIKMVVVKKLDLPCPDPQWIWRTHKTKERIQSAGGEWQSAGLKLGIDALVFKGENKF